MEDKELKIMEERITNIENRLTDMVFKIVDIDKNTKRLIKDVAILSKAVNRLLDANIERELELSNIRWANSKR